MILTDRSGTHGDAEGSRASPAVRKAFFALLIGVVTYLLSRRTSA